MKSILYLLILMASIAFSQQKLLVLDINGIGIYRAKVEIKECKHDNCSSQAVISIFDQNDKRIIHSRTEKEISGLFYDEMIKVNSQQISYEDQGLIVYEDFNFDGIKDLAIADGNYSCNDSMAFAVFINQNGKFIHSKEFSALTTNYCGIFQADAISQRIYTSRKNGCCHYQFSEFGIENNLPKQLKISERSPGKEGYYIEWVTKEWKNEKWLERSYKTLLDEESRKDIEIFSFKLDDKTKDVYLIGNPKGILTFQFTNKDGIIQLYKDSDFIFQTNETESTLSFNIDNTEYIIYQALDLNESGLRFISNGKKFFSRSKPGTLHGRLDRITKNEYTNVIIK